MSAKTKQLNSELQLLADPKTAKASAWFFKTEKGDYGYGDVFLGIKVPVIRNLIKGYLDLSLDEIASLAESKYHEVRFAALAILVAKFKKAKQTSEQKLIFSAFLKLLRANRVNNWDLVDITAPFLGKYLVDNPAEQAILTKLAASKNLWEQRTAIMFTFAFIRAAQPAVVFDLVPRFLTHPHDLIHKAAGWMLREAGKKDLAGLRKFLSSHSKKMPRTMLRYSIEKLSATERAKWLAS